MEFFLENSLYFSLFFIFLSTCLLFPIANYGKNILDMSRETDLRYISFKKTESVKIKNLVTTIIMSTIFMWMGIISFFIYLVT